MHDRYGYGLIRAALMGCSVQMLTKLGSQQGKTGIAVVKTKQAILVGHYGENVQAGNATQTVEALADYLIKVGY